MKTLVMASAMFIVSATALLGAELHPLAVDMSGARVATGERAQARLYEHLIQAKDDGLSAMQSARAIASFKIGFDVPDFARTGDRIWLLHVAAIDDDTVKRVAWINAESAAVTFLLEDQGESATEGLQLRCAMARTEFAVGEMLPPPKVTIRNSTDVDVDLVGPTITVIACTLVQPDKARIPMVLAMPTGRDPRQMPSQKLEAGAEMGFVPAGIWHYVDKGGFQPYVFQQEGSYTFTCRYEGLICNPIAITVRGAGCEPDEAATVLGQGCRAAKVKLGPKPTMYSGPEAAQSEIVDEMRAWLESLAGEDAGRLQETGRIDFRYQDLKESDPEHAQIVDGYVKALESKVSERMRAKGMPAPLFTAETVSFIRHRVDARGEAVEGAYEFRVEFADGSISNRPLSGPL